jgi:hypothetical protein
MLAFWAVARTLAAMFASGPVLRLDPNRIVFRTRGRHIVLAWDDATFAFGRLFLKIAVGPSRFAIDAETPGEVVVPLPLLKGGAAGLKEAIAKVRPDALPRTPQPRRRAS